MDNIRSGEINSRLAIQEMPAVFKHNNNIFPCLQELITCLYGSNK
jgi:hypothetical protein